MAKRTQSDKIQGWVYKSSLLICSILMGLFSYAGMISFFSSDSIMRLIVLFTLVPAFFFLVIFVHEMGHALAAWALGYRVHFIAVGSHGFNPVKRKFQKVTDYSDNEVAGFIQYSPNWPLKSRWGEVIVSLAGPLATILLGIILLEFHKNLGTRTIYFDVPKNIPKIYSRADGKVIQTIPHQGFIFLAIVCFFDALANLLPLKSGDENTTDGRDIFESLFESMWTAESWLNQRAYAAYYYQQDYVSDKEWQEFRQQCWQSHDPERSNVLRAIAWHKTDPAAFLAITHIDDIKETESTKHIIWQYVVSSVLLGQYSPELVQIMPKEIDKENYIYHFAKVLLEYGGGNNSAISHAIKDARETFTDKSGRVPDEEEAIFKAIENGDPLPALKWD